MSERDRTTNRSTLWIILAVCVAPFIASIFAYVWWQPEGRVNYGELVLPTVVPVTRLETASGEPFSFASLKGKWILVTVDSSSCDQYCQKKLWKMRQVRRAQGKDMDRVERVWLLPDKGRPDPAVLSAYSGTHAVSAADSPVLAALPVDGALRDHIYLIDPLGNLMLRYPREADPSRMRKDLVRLLKVSQIG